MFPALVCQCLCNKEGLPLVNSIMGKLRQLDKKAGLFSSVWQQGEPALISIFYTLYDIPALSEMHPYHCKDQNCPPSTSSLGSNGWSPGCPQMPSLSSEAQETWTMERGDVGVSKYLLLEPTKPTRIRSWAGSSSICSSCAAPVTAAAPAAEESSSGHWELLVQQYFSDACEVITNSSSHCPLMEGGLINYITLSQLSMLRDNQSTVSPSSKTSSKLATTPCV